MASAMTSKEASSTHDLSLLYKSAGGVDIPPQEDQITTLLHQRFRTDNPYTRLSSSTLVVVNPLKTLANLNDASAGDYKDSEYTDTSGDEPQGGPMQPHLYELAARVYLVMRRRKESQAVVFRSVPFSSVCSGQAVCAGDPGLSWGGGKATGRGGDRASSGE